MPVQHKSRFRDHISLVTVAGKSPQGIFVFSSNVICMFYSPKQTFYSLLMLAFLKR